VTVADIEASAQKTISRIEEIDHLEDRQVTAIGTILGILCIVLLLALAGAG
jgi:hypothetical protein